MKPARRRVRPIVVWWTTLLVACALAFALKLWQNHEVTSRARAEAKAWRDTEARARSAPLRVPEMFDALQREVAAGQRRAPTTQDVADLLNGGRPVGESQPGRALWYWTDPKTSMLWELRFHDDVWIGYEKRFYNSAVPEIRGLPRSVPPPLYDEIERASYFIQSHGWMAGVVVGLAVALTIWLRQAAPLAHVLLGVAVICLAAASMPLRTQPPPIVLPLLDRLPGILLMIGVACIALRIHMRPRRVRPGEGPKCEQCGYDLTGNISGVCPECGSDAPTPPPRRASAASESPAS